VNWATVKQLFYAGLFFSFVVGGLTKIAIMSQPARSYGSDMLMNFSEILDLVGLATIVLGLALLGRWIRSKALEWSASRKERAGPQLNSLQKDTQTERWNALVRYDDEVRTAAEQLRPFGNAAVNELAKGFFALNEDRRYLPNIVRRISEEAQREQTEREQKAK
jgi:hypothetical protein